MADRTPRVENTVTAGELMNSPVLTINARANVAEAAKLVLVNRVGSAVVLDEK